MAVYSTIIANSFRLFRTKWSGPGDSARSSAPRRSHQATSRPDLLGASDATQQAAPAQRGKSRFTPCGVAMDRDEMPPDRRAGLTPRGTLLCPRGGQICRHLRYPMPFHLRGPAGAILDSNAVDPPYRPGRTVFWPTGLDENDLIRHARLQELNRSR